MKTQKFKKGYTRKDGVQVKSHTQSYSYRDFAKMRLKKIMAQQGAKKNMGAALKQVGKEWKIAKNMPTDKITQNYGASASRDDLASFNPDEPDREELNDFDNKQYEEEERLSKYGLSSYGEDKPQIMEEKGNIALVRHNDPYSPASEHSDVYEIRDSSGKVLWSSGTTYMAEFIAEGGAGEVTNTLNKEARQRFKELAKEKNFGANPWPSLSAFKKDIIENEVAVVGHNMRKKDIPILEAEAKKWVNDHPKEVKKDYEESNKFWTIIEQKEKERNKWYKDDLKRVKARESKGNFGAGPYPRKTLTKEEADSLFKPGGTLIALTEEQKQAKENLFNVTSFSKKKTGSGLNLIRDEDKQNKRINRGR